MIGASLFHPDSSFGFPPGTPEGPPVLSTVHGTLHMTAFFLAFFSLLAAAFVFARRFLRRREKGWAVYSVVSALAVPVLMGTSGAIPAWAGVIVAIAGLVLFGWLAVVTAHVRVERSALVSAAPAQARVAM
jgi:asparagine N-glycosylation enzyme membrane subunit Stt3